MPVSGSSSPYIPGLFRPQTRFSGRSPSPSPQIKDEIKNYINEGYSLDVIPLFYDGQASQRQIEAIASSKRKRRNSSEPSPSQEANPTYLPGDSFHSPMVINDSPSPTTSPGSGYGTVHNLSHQPTPQALPVPTPSATPFVQAPKPASERTQRNLSPNQAETANPALQKYCQKFPGLAPFLKSNLSYENLAGQLLSDEEQGVPNTRQKQYASTRPGGKLNKSGAQIHQWLGERRYAMKKFFQSNPKGSQYTPSSSSSRSVPSQPNLTAPPAPPPVKRTKTIPSRPSPTTPIPTRLPQEAPADKARRLAERNSDPMGWTRQERVLIENATGREGAQLKVSANADKRVDGWRTPPR